MIAGIAESLIHDSSSNEELRQRVVLHLTSCRLEFCGFNANVEEGSVTLRGELPTFLLRQLAIERTRRVAGVRRLVDEIEVPAIARGFHRSPK